MGSNEKNNKITKKQRLLRSMEIPISGIRLEISDDISAELEGCTGILAYDENEVRLSAGKLIICLVGSNLQITQYDKQMTVIEGIINMVRYERG